MCKNKLHLLVGTLIFSILTSACSNLKTQRKARGEKSRQSESQNFGESDYPRDNKDREDSFTEAPVRPKNLVPPKLGIILGPGMALALSHAGVLKAFDDAKIPIEHIVGMGWGAIVGSMYAKQGMANDAQWRIYKLKRSDLPESGYFSSGIQTGSASLLRPFLKESLGSVKMGRGKIPFACPMANLKNGKAFWPQRGSMVNVVSNCAAFPPFFGPVNKRLVGGLFAIREAVDYLKDRGAELIIFVNVLHNQELLKKEVAQENFQAQLLWNEIRRTTLASYGIMGQVIQVPTSSYLLTDFDAKKRLIPLGEKAGKRALEKLTENYGF